MNNVYSHICTKEAKPKSSSKSMRAEQTPVAMPNDFKEDMQSEHDKRMI